MDGNDKYIRFRIGSIAFRVTFLIFFSRKKKKEGFQMFFLGFNSASFEAQVEDVIEERILRGKQAKKQLPEKV